MSVVTFAPASFPTLPTLSLTDDEQRLLTLLLTQRPDDSDMQLADAYYLEEQEIEDLAIGVPSEVSAKLKCLLGWPKQAVDPYVDRLAVDGFRLPGATDADERLREYWDDSQMDSEQSLTFTDALSLGRGYLAVGKDLQGDVRMVAESPLSMNVRWDITGRHAEAALQRYRLDNRAHAALYLPDRTIQVAQDDDGNWKIQDRDNHKFGRVPIVRIANNARTRCRQGRSEITPALRSLVDQACESLMGLRVAGQIYSVPRELILGATERDFQDSDGNPKTAWETFITSLRALERDEDGNLPEVKQMAVYDPSVYTKVIDMYAAQAAGMLSAPPQDFGLYTDGNPVSNESWAASEGRRDRRAMSKQRQWGPALAEAMQLRLRFEHNGDLPEEFRRIAVDWCDVSIATPSTTSDAISKQITAGAIPKRSDVTLKRLGYSAIERQRLAQDWTEQDQRDEERLIAESFGGGNGGAAGPVDA